MICCFNWFVLTVDCVTSFLCFVFVDFDCCFVVLLFIVSDLLFVWCFADDSIGFAVVGWCCFGVLAIGAGFLWWFWLMLRFCLLFVLFALVCCCFWLVYCNIWLIVIFL